MKKAFKILPKWWNFAQSGHTGPCVYFIHAVGSWSSPFPGKKVFLFFIRRERKYRAGALVLWLWQMTHIREVVGSNPGGVFWMDIFHIDLFCSFEKTENNRKREVGVGPFFDRKYKYWKVRRILFEDIEGKYLTRKWWKNRPEVDGILKFKSSKATLSILIG